MTGSRVRGFAGSRVRREGITRRAFLGGAAVLAGSFGAAPAVLRAARRAGDVLNVAVVGAGGRGADDLEGLRPTAARIVALCDCDARQAAESFKNYPDAARYSDWRQMFDKQKDIDAVLVATPDHNHAVVSIAAIRLKRHRRRSLAPRN